MLVTVDTGGTKTLIASFREDGAMGEAIKFPTPHAQAEYAEFLVTELKKRYADTALDAVVIACPGRIENGIIKKASNLGWYDFDLQKVISAEFDCPILIQNDAALASLAAYRQLEKPVHTCLYVTISTGIGSGLVVNGALDTEYKRGGGGHIVLEFNGELMFWEDFASGRAIKDEYGQFASEIDEPRIWSEIADKISRGFLVLSPLLRPDVIVIGGSIGTYFDLYRETLLQILHDHLPIVPPIIAAKNPEQIVLYGCYYHAVDYLTRRAA